MDEEVVDVIQKMVEGTSTSSATSRRENNDDVADVIDELLDRISVWYEPSNLEIDFNQADYRKAPSMASASSVSGSEIMDLSDSELPFLESGEDSEKEFERLQGYTSALRVKTYKQEHSDGVPQEKKLRADRVDKSDLEHEYDTLPLLENLTIHCEETVRLEIVGHVVSVVDCLVVIQSDTGVALDFDSVLFDRDRNSIGVVYDLFGPVRCPYYSVRFNTKEEAAKMYIGMNVYYAPAVEKYTKTVIDKPVKSEIPSDECISDEIVFSDDEKEKEYRMRKSAAAAAAKRPDVPNDPKRGRKRNVQFSQQAAPQQARGGGAGGNRSQSNAATTEAPWHWHNWRHENARGGQGRGRFSARGNRRGRGVPASSGQNAAPNPENPYSEYGCYGPVPFVDSRSV